jgi:hypothetical protein
MTQQSFENPFDAKPDAELGHLLRECLEAPDPDAFAARVRAAIGAEPRAEREGSWEILARWARPGLAAAAIVLLSLGMWLSGEAESVGATLADALQPAGAPAALFASAGSAPSTEALFAEEAP